MLYSAVKNCLPSNLKSVCEYAPFPKYADRAAWAGVSEEIKAHYVGLVNGILRGETLPPLRANRYMDYMRNGNRTRYQTVYFQRRETLLALLLAECMVGDGDLIDEIIDVIWAICEETSWVVPAHNNQQGMSPRSLPDIEAPMYIDLFAAETGSSIAWAYYFLSGEIEKRAPLAKRRMEIEMKRRILDPYLADDSFGWKGLETDRPVNNWNPWINSNILSAFLVMENDERRRQEGVLRTAKSTQRFFDMQSEDGGCDEGPGYFGAAGCSLLDYLEEIGYATGGAVNLYDKPVVRNLAKYIYRVHAGGEFYVNFADAAAQVQIAAGLLTRVARKIDDEALYTFCRYMLKNGFTAKPYACERKMLYRTISSIFGFEPLDDAKAEYIAPRDHYFEGIQVMTARQKHNSTDGIFVAFKGGHNAESHNHNDVGNFIIYRDGKPVVIDAGVETYTRKTFSPDRYDIWTMRSDYHNLPDINGYTQLPGRECAAQNVSYAVNGDVTEMSLDIAPSYPAEAGIKAFGRSVRFDRAAQTVAVRDVFSLEKATCPLVMRVMLFDLPDAATPGVVKLGGLVLEYDASAFDAAVGVIEMTDAKIIGDWGKQQLFRLSLTAKAAAKTGEYTLVFRA